MASTSPGHSKPPVYLLTGGAGDFLQCAPFLLNERDRGTRFAVATHLGGAKALFDGLGVQIEAIEHFKDLEGQAQALARLRTLGSMQECPRAPYFECAPLPRPAHKFRNGHKTLGVHLGGSGFSVALQRKWGVPVKSLPPELLEPLFSEDLNIYLFGSPDEIAALGLRETDRLRFICEPDISRSLAYVQLCDAFLGSDSAFKTMSSMQRIPTIVWLADYPDEPRDRLFINPYVHDQVMWTVRFNELQPHHIQAGMQFTRGVLQKLGIVGMADGKISKQPGSPPATVAGPGITRRLRLPDVTLCAVDSATPELAATALDRCLEQCDFGRAILLTSKPVRTEAECIVTTPITSRQAYSQFILRGLTDYVRTSHVLVVQWDGYIIDPCAWDPGFLSFDYIGARWPWHADGHDVGNGGFSLRSLRLLEALRDPSFDNQVDENEDDLICRRNRPMLEARHGIRFAPGQVADRFAYEHAQFDAPAFGFHGLFNLWRHMDDKLLLETVSRLSPATWLTRSYIVLLVKYVELRKFSVAREMFRLMLQAGDEAVVLQALRAVFQEPETGYSLLSLGRELLEREKLLGLTPTNSALSTRIPAKSLEGQGAR